MINFKSALSKQDLLVDATYSGGRSGNASDDPLVPLIGVSNQGGFRYLGTKEVPLLIVLTSTLKNSDWPDELDKENGLYTYFGDNRKPGHELHDTPRFGNLLLRNIFDWSHGDRDARKNVPPVLVFANTGLYRDVDFLGLAVPGAEHLSSNNDLVALWKLSKGKRFQNYQAKFTILDTEVVSAKWLEDVKDGNPLSNACPSAWRHWSETGMYRPLKAPRVIQHRTRDEQLPMDQIGLKLLRCLQNFFADQPVRFEACAAKLAELMLGNIVSIDLTRPTKDGGRDAIGKYRIGSGDSSVLVDFALEAKCYELSNSVGVKELSRLISRLRHRQFGILVTTSFVAAQAYQEIKEDNHPIIIISANDISKILKGAGLKTEAEVLEWAKDF